MALGDALSNMSIGGFFKFIFVSWWWRNGRLNWVGIIAMIFVIAWIVHRLKGRRKSGEGGYVYESGR